MILSDAMKTVIAGTMNTLRAGGPVTAAPKELVRRVLEMQIQAHEIVTGSFAPEERERMVAEVEARINVHIGQALDLVDGTDHMEWYLGERRAPGPFLARYLRRLAKQDWAEDPIERLRETTARVIELIEDPVRDGPWDRRGLVMGHVQSGKTAHYTGVICRAADAGYRIIIVLAGMHNLLRSQTQRRLDGDFLGFDTSPERQRDGARKAIGVGLDDPGPQAEFVTTSAINGDFRKNVANNLGFTPDQRPWLFVIKKNASVLNALNGWISDLKERNPRSLNEPLLVVDDEADQASIDTNAQPQDDDGTFDEDYDPTRINGQIRRLLQAFKRKAYVAYTATPFANILIHDEARAQDYGPDLFPAGFIISLPAPSTYMGPSSIFGLDDEGRESHAPLPVIEPVDQTGEAWIPVPHRKDFRPLFEGQDRIPPSLESATQSFILGRAANEARGRGAEHASMLIHVSRFVAVQEHVHRQVTDWFEQARRTITYGFGGSTLERQLKALWEGDFETAARAIRESPFGSNLTPLRWDDVRNHLATAVERIQVVVVNRKSAVALDYENYKERGLHVIAVGGDKLSRGLTLEGLMVSYFLRTSTLYDTLMQMGRWFGYRSGYADLCRLFLTDDLKGWYRHIATAAEELRAQFNHMSITGATPKDYGLRIASHDVMAVTAANKMRAGLEVDVSFAGESKIQTIFETDVNRIRSNFKAVAQFIEGHRGAAETDPPRPNGSIAHGLIWRGVSGTEIVDLLRSFTYSRDALDVNERIPDYISLCNQYGELIDWTIFLATGDREEFKLAGYQLKAVERSAYRERAAGSISYKSILNRPDEAIDLTPDGYREALEQTILRKSREEPGGSAPGQPAGPEIRAVRGRDPKRGLLVFYPLSPAAANVISDVPLMGVVVSFPDSKRRRTVRYVVNSVTQRLELAT